MKLINTTLELWWKNESNARVREITFIIFNYIDVSLLSTTKHKPLPPSIEKVNIIFQCDYMHVQCIIFPIHISITFSLKYRFLLSFARDL